MQNVYENFVLNSVKKGYIYDQDKAISPIETYENVLSKLRECFPDKKYELIPIVEGEFFVYTFTDGILKAHGKGATKEQCMASAIMEFAERLSWMNYDYKNADGYRFISFNELRKEKDVEFLKDVFYISYSDNKEWFYQKLIDVPMHWVKGYSLTRNEEVDYPVNWNNAYQTSNGLASGNVKEEAILQALCEVVERHNLDVFLRDFDKLKLRLIRHDELYENVILKELLEKLKKKNIDLYIIDISTEIDIPTIVVCGIDNSKEENTMGHCVFGYGTQAEPMKAIIRAITEFVQLKGLNANYYGSYKEHLVIKNNWQFFLNVNIKDKIKDAVYVSYETLNDVSDDDFKIELENVVELMKERSSDVVLVDKTWQKTGVPVYRVFVTNVLPGTTFASTNENDMRIYLQMLLHAGMKEVADEYYRENFEKVIFDNSQEFLEIFFQLNPDVTIEMLKEYVGPEEYPLFKFLKDDYIKQLRYNHNDEWE